MDREAESLRARGTVADLYLTAPLLRFSAFPSSTKLGGLWRIILTAPLRCWHGRDQIVQNYS